eukprot:9495019-Pyramimonas_sp.AAC.1
MLLSVLAPAPQRPSSPLCRPALHLGCVPVAPETQMEVSAIFNAAHRACRALHCPRIVQLRLAEAKAPDNQVLASPAPLKPSCRYRALM